MNEILEMPFLGKRNYLQGSTLLDYLLPFVPASAQMLFKCHKMLRTNRVKLTDDASEAKSPEASAMLHWKQGEQEGYLAVTPMPASDPILRVPYPEEELIRTASFEDDSIAVCEHPGFSLAACATSLNKALLQKLHPADSAHRWILTAFSLQQLPEISSPMKIKLVNMLAHRFAKSHIFVADKLVGEIFFSTYTDEA